MKKWWKIIFLLPVVFAVLYGGGYIAQFIRNYKEWELAGGTGSPAFPKFDLAACFTALTTMPYGLMGVGLCIVLLALLIFSIVHPGEDDIETRDRERNLSYSSKGTYGTAGFMTESEMGEVLELCDPRKTDGTILGKLNGKAVCLPLKSRTNGVGSMNRNMGEVYKLLTVSSEAGLKKLFGVLPMSHPAKAPYNIFKQAAESVRGGIIIGLGSRLQVFQNQLICEMTSCDDIDLELPGRQKCAYFCITSDQDSTFDFLSSLFFSFLFIKLVRYADKHCSGGKLTVPTTFVCDEFPNIGTIPDFCKKISTVRSRGLNISIIFQNLAQLQNRYPQNQWQEILGNCDTQLFLGCTDELTATFISNRTGDVTIGVSSKAKQLSTWRVSNYTPDYRETSSIGKRKLLTPDEVLRLPLDKALVILRGQKVLKSALS